MRIYLPEKQEILSTFHWTGIETDTYQAVLIHKLGWLVGEFEIK